MHWKCRGPLRLLRGFTTWEFKNMQKKLRKIVQTSGYRKALKGWIFIGVMQIMRWVYGIFNLTSFALFIAKVNKETWWEQTNKLKDNGALIDLGWSLTCDATWAVRCCWERIRLKWGIKMYQKSFNHRMICCWTLLKANKYIMVIWSQGPCPWTPRGGDPLDPLTHFRAVILTHSLIFFALTAVLLVEKQQSS